MIIKPFRCEDLENMEVQDIQRAGLESMDDHAMYLMENSEAYTVSHDGRILVCSGLVPIWANRAWVWSFVAKNIKHHMISITRLAKEVMDASPFTILEAYTISGHDEGGRWLNMLGFDLVRPNVPNLLMNDYICDIYMKVK